MQSCREYFGVSELLVLNAQDSFDRCSVQFPFFDDALRSYLNSVSGLTRYDLQGLKEPLQVRDVVILPCVGFHPFRNQLPNPMARVVHLFRGSWK